MKVAQRFALAAALLFVAAATLTPGGSQIASVLRPNFWCFACGALGGADVTVNIALFIPLGMTLAWMGGRPLRVLVWAAVLSAAIESAQRFGVPAGRVANATDILTNTLGGFVGALLVHYTSDWLFPTRRRAVQLMVSSATAAVSLCVLTAWSLSPLPTPTKPLPIRKSAHPFTPGFGWYHGFVSRVTVNDETFLHAGDGPVILRGISGRSQTVRVELSGRDEREGFVPFLYLHGENLTHPELLLGQERDDARLSRRLRGSRFRLPGPHAVLPGAFANVSADMQTIRATITAARWTLSSERDGVRHDVTLPMSLGLGWTLFQTVVRDTPTVVRLISAAWLLAMWLPLGFWSACAGRADGPSFAGPNRGMISREVMGGLGVVLITLGLVPVWAGIAVSSWVEWLSAIAGFGSGVFFASRVWRTQHRFDAPSLGHRHPTQTQ